ncbi:MAG TPA: hypothetical protein VGE77_12540 [Nocardioides sp.]
MLGRLPRRHRRVLVLVAMTVFVIAGLIVGAASAVPVLMPTAITAGTAVGMLAAFVLVHDFHHG